MNCREHFLTRESEQAVRHTVYLFEGFQLDVTRRKLISSGGLVQPLNSRAMEALLLLVSNAGELIEKRRLMQTIWPTAIVEDNNLNQCILAIRKALGESAGSNRYVMTVPGRGYRFVCPVRELEQESPSSIRTAPSKNRDRSPATALRWILPAAIFTLAAALTVLYFAGSATTQLAAGVDLPAASGPVPSSIVLRLTAPELNASGPASTESAMTVVRCLAANPDLKLQVRVQMVTNQGAPVWTGDFTAGAQDLIPVPASHVAQPRDCPGLIAPHAKDSTAALSR